MVLACFQNFEKNQRFLQKSAFFFCKNPEISHFFLKFLRFLQNFATFSKNQLDSFVDLEKPEKMRIWLQNFVSIQPRTSLEKSDVSWPTVTPGAGTAIELLLRSWTRYRPGRRSRGSVGEGRFPRRPGARDTPARHDLIFTDL